MCCLCKCKNETISHIVSGCKILASSKYLNRHNDVAKYIHQLILQFFNVTVCQNWYSHVPDNLTTGGDIFNVYWDFTFPMDSLMGANRPDILIHDKKIAPFKLLTSQFRMTITLPPKQQKNLPSTKTCLSS